MTSEPAGADVLNPSERAELERLRAEVARLQEEASSAGIPPVRPPRADRARRVARTALAVFLITISCALAPLSVASVWLRSEVTDTDRYVATVAPLAQDPAIQRAITANLTDIVFTYIDVQALTEQTITALTERGSLPPAVATQLQALAVPVANGVRSFAQDRIMQVVQSEVFAQAWEQANRTAHEQLNAALTGETGGGVTVEGNAVKVDLAAFLAVVKQQLVANGFELAARIPAVEATFTVFESADVSKVQSAFNLLDTLGLWLPFILVALAALGIYLARNHRLAFIGTGAGVALAMLIAALALAWARRAYLNGVPDAVLPPDAAAVLFDTVVRYLRDALRAAFLIGLLVALGGFLTGPSVTAVTVRRWLVAGFAFARGGLAAQGLPLTGVTHWVAPRAHLLRGLVVAAALGALLVQRYRTPALVGWVTAGVLLALAVVEFLAVEPRSRRSPTPPLPAATPATAGG